MNRLAFQPVLRAARASVPRPCLAAARAVRAGCSTTAARRLASTSSSAPAAPGAKNTTTPSPPTPEFERMLSSLYPGMQSEDLAKRVAVLYMMTDKKNEIEAVEKRLHSIMRGESFEPVAKRIKHYLKNPPKDLLQTKAPPLSHQWLNPQAQKALGKAGMTAFDYLTVLMESDPSVRLLKSLDEATSERVETSWVELKETGDSEVLTRLLNFYSQHGLDFAPPSAETIPLVKEMKERSKTDDTPMLTEEEAAELEADPVLFAKKAARDSSWNPLQASAAQAEAAPDLMIPDPYLDPKDVIDFPPTKDTPYHNRVIVYNHRSVFHDYDKTGPDGEPGGLGDAPNDFNERLTVSPSYYRSLNQSILIRRPVVQQTGKGKIRRVAFLVLVGNENGLVGLGEGKHANSMVAMKSAQIDAVRNMDWVERFEKRTVWTEMRTKLGGTELILRPRPVGFGLRCNPYLHQILRAAGFKDISAKVWGSRNRLNVIKAAFRLLQAGHDPTGMGNGLGGPGKKLAKGSGIVGMQEVERARGRKLVSLRK
ncbi:37S ribosomal protein S5 [Ephemerocybe angulata]|uniref:Small ribosomal subunit protein uS5m n=1 Tax=Ephemerocybe angulata TaxID=980116 RepID=A0A8H6IES9_9AGAR|nr:37S ribosomal protein S5 [Tulosesus angulatus]